MPPTADDRRLVLIAGSVRSGTSTAAGTLHHLGLHVPLPVVEANASNPAGFFESRWPLRFHRRLMDKALTTQSDTRPDAFELMAGAVGEAERGELRTWLEAVFDDARQVVIKDPRAAWVPGLWADTGRELGVDTAFLTMLRHPAEVVASKKTHYMSGSQGRHAVRYRIRSVGNWININIGIERRTRGRPRVMARYEDLVVDWHRVMTRVRDAFDLDVDLARDANGRHPVDAFIDPSLRRHEPSWDGMGLPARLIEIAEGVWEAMGQVVDGADGPEVSARLDELARAYATEIDDARALMQDALAAEAARVKRGDPPTVVLQPTMTLDDTANGPRRLARRVIPMRIRRLVVGRATRGAAPR